MKTYNKMKVRSLTRKLAVLGLTMVVAASCGSDKKNTTTSTSSTSSSTLATNDATFASQWNNLKATLSCSTGGSRSSDRYYYSSSNSSSLTAGSVSGTFVGNYFGQHSQGHAFAVQKVTDGSTVYYNVVVSLCSYTSTYYNTTVTALDDSDTLNSPTLSATRINSNSCAHDFMSGYFRFQSTNLASYVQLPFAPQAQVSASCY